MRDFMFYHSSFRLQIPGISPPLPPPRGSARSGWPLQSPPRCCPRVAACSPPRSAPPRTRACLPGCGCGVACYQLTRARTLLPPRSIAAQTEGSCWGTVSRRSRGVVWCYPSPPPPGSRGSRRAPPSRWGSRYRASTRETEHWESIQYHLENSQGLHWESNL